MKKKLYLIATILASVTALCLSSCLKDPRYLDFSKVGTLVEFPLGGLENFGADAVTETPDTDANGTITLQFAVNIASPTVPTTATTVTLGVDNSIVTSYNALGGAVTYLPMPAADFVFTTTSVTIPAGQRSAIASVTFYKNLLDPSKSYMLPIKIVSATGGGTISGNFGIHYFHFIGNDFAGAYEHYFDRWHLPDSTAANAANHDMNHVDEGGVIFSPISPTEFTVATSYYTGPNYDVTFTKTGTGTSALYSNFQIQFLPADVAAGGQWASNITVVQQPEIASLNYNYNPNATYTYAQSLLLFRFYFTTLTRAVIDTYVKP